MQPGELDEEGLKRLEAALDTPGFVAGLSVQATVGGIKRLIEEIRRLRDENAALREQIASRRELAGGRESESRGEGDNDVTKPERFAEA